MSTRRAKDQSVLHQNRYASSAEFERGLLANLVAKRVALVDDEQVREFIWAVHYFSHQPGGLKRVAAQLIEKYGDQIGSREMVMIGKAADGQYSADETRAVRKFFENDFERFPLRGELSLSAKAKILHLSNELTMCERFDDEGGCELPGYRKIQTALEAARAAAQIESESFPESYPVSTFLHLCRKAAGRDLERDLKEFCLNPAGELAPWYFCNLIEVLKSFVAQWKMEHGSLAETKLSRIVADEFDYTWHSRCLTLLEGEPRRGKSFAAKKCCLRNPGRARYVETPPGNDETTFFRELARGLGLGNLAQYTLADVRDRVVNLLLSGDFILVLDEAQRLWPAGKQRLPHYPRINWIMTLANHKVPILLVATPQFMNAQNQAELLGWNSSQLTGRLANYKELPSQLDDVDLIAIAREFLPEAGNEILQVLAAYARASSRYIAAIETITTRARYLAGRNGRTDCTAEDVRTAMQESVIPSDNRLKVALEKTRAGKSHPQLPYLATPRKQDLAPTPGPAHPAFSTSAPRVNAKVQSKSESDFPAHNRLVPLSGNEASTAINP